AFLQNAWSPLYAGGTWPRHSWLAALHGSRSGKRLKSLTGECPTVEFWWDNTTPMVGPHPSLALVADLRHMAQTVVEQKPDAVLAFGRQAASAVSQLALEPFIPVLVL